jgi:hypothetical protein
MEGFIKEIFIKIKKVDMVVNYMGMEIYLLDIFHKIKNMEKVRFIGLVFALLPVQNNLV